jgi:hypothetical protein
MSYSISNAAYSTIFRSLGSVNDWPLDISVDKLDPHLLTGMNNATGNLEVTFNMPSTSTLTRDICMNVAGNNVLGYHILTVPTVPENHMYKWLMDWDLNGITWNGAEGDVLLTLYGTEHASNVVEAIPLAHYTEGNAIDFVYNPCSFDYNENLNNSFANDARNSKLKIIDGLNFLYYAHEWKYSDVTAVLSFSDFGTSNSAVILRELDILPGTVLPPSQNNGGGGLDLASVEITASNTTGFSNTPVATINYSQVFNVMNFHLEATWQGAITTDNLDGDLIIEILGLTPPVTKNIVDVKYQLPLINGFEIAVKGEIFASGGRTFIKIKAVINNKELFVRLTNNGTVEIDGKYWLS